VIDITPTVLEVCGVSAPETYRGVAQIPVHGTSFAYTFDAPGEPTRKVTQYFEMYGHRSIWHRGWKAVTRHQPGTSFEDERWELYHLDADFSETRDLATAEPARLAELRERWWAEAGRFDVMPLDDRNELFSPKARPGSIRARSRFEYFPPVDNIPAEAAPLTQDVSHAINVALRREAGQDGPIVAFGNVLGGYALFVEGDRLVYAYNRVGEIAHLESALPLPAGDVSCALGFTRTGPLAGVARLTIGGRPAGELALDRMLLRLSLFPLCIGRAMQPAVSPRIPRAVFAGRLDRVVFTLGSDRGAAPGTLDID
jgi:arylsulfatase